MRGHLNDRKLLAGEKLRRDYERDAIAGSVTMRWDGLGQSSRKSSVSGDMNPTEHMIAAKHRFDAALVALGTDLSDIAWRVICVGETMFVAERGMAWPAR